MLHTAPSWLARVHHFTPDPCRYVAALHLTRPWIVDHQPPVCCAADRPACLGAAAKARPTGKPGRVRPRRGPTPRPAAPGSGTKRPAAKKAPTRRVPTRQVYALSHHLTGSAVNKWPAERSCAHFQLSIGQTQALHIAVLCQRTVTNRARPLLQEAGSQAQAAQAASGRTPRAAAGASAAAAGLVVAPQPAAKGSSPGAGNQSLSLFWIPTSIRTPSFQFGNQLFPLF